MLNEKNTLKAITKRELIKYFFDIKKLFNLYVGVMPSPTFL